MRKSTFLPLLFCFIACENDEHPATRLRVNHYKQPATGESDHFAFVIQNENKFGSEEWSTYRSNIEGFVYDWGYSYELLVTEEELSNPLQDASAIKTTLKGVVSKQKIRNDTRFEIRLTRTFDDGGFHSYVNGDLSSGYTILGTVAVNCGNLCDDLALALASREPLVGVFNHLESGIKLVELKKQ